MTSLKARAIAQVRVSGTEFRKNKGAGLLVWFIGSKGYVKALEPPSRTCVNACMHRLRARAEHGLTM